MSLWETHREGIESVGDFIQQRPLEPPKPPLETYPSELIIFVVIVFVGLVTYRKLRHRLRQPINRVAFVTLVPSYILSAIFMAHDMAQCQPLRCKPWLWESLSYYLSYDDFQLIMSIAITSFVVAFFFDETILKLFRWIKNG